MKTLKKILQVSLIILLFTSCSKDDVPDTPVTPTVKDIYICGDVFDSFFTTTATYWKNGVATHLTDGIENSDAWAITVQGDDVYVAGWEYNGTTLLATYWKNGIATHLSTSHSIANAITVVGDDVYITGVTSSGATYWKNGIAIPLTDGTLDSGAYDITVVGDDNYVVGYETKGTIEVATYWKNGIAKPLTDGSSNAFAYAISVVGDDVYVAGSERNSAGKSVAKYWKNGIAMPLTDGTQHSSANAISLVGDDVYVAGSGGYWKNGILNSLNAEGVAMTVVSKDVYVAGNKQKNNGYQVATYWKNGSEVNFVPDAVFGSRAFDIFITTE